jgi:8-oxo-dGTP pyrophosphatase MutT (NUDIX family)
MAGTERELVAAGLILRRITPRGPVWLLLRSSKHGEWGFPKGHQDPGETLVQTALRETVEETGIALVAIDGPALELHYVVPNGRQKRTVYYPAHTGTSAIALSHEHDTGAWFPASGVLQRLPYPKLKALFNATRKATAASDAAAPPAPPPPARPRKPAPPRKPARPAATPRKPARPARGSHR